MKKCNGIYVWLVVVGIIFTSNGTTAKTAGMVNNDYSAKILPNIIVFKYKKTKSNALAKTEVLQKISHHSVSDIQRAVTDDKILAKTSVRLEDINYARFESGESPFVVAAELAENDNIEYAEPIYLSQIDATPNDSLFQHQEYLDVIQAAEAWDFSKAEGKDIVIAIVDGGTDIDHPDLQANLWVNEDEIPDNGIDDDNNGFVDDVNGWNFANNTNDPTGLTSTPSNANHGTQTAGIAVAVTNNKAGIAGVSWNAQLMPLNISSETDKTLSYTFYNFDGKPGGVLYAAQNGADIISCSWGHLGGFSSYEQDMVNAVTEMGAIMVAAAGNDNSGMDHFPSAYDNVLSIGGTNNSDEKYSGSNYGPQVDVVAPALMMMTTFNNSNYGVVGAGTSYSAPLVSGVIALVKAKYPELSNYQAAEQVRVTADNINAQNPAYIDKLGKGRVNAFRAVTENELPSIHLLDINYVDENGNGIIEQGEDIEIFPTIKNYLSPASNVQLTLQESDRFVILTSKNASIPAIGTMEELSLTTPLKIHVSTAAPNGHPVDFKLVIEAGDYNDFAEFNLTIMPLFADININNVATTISSIGRIGFADDGDNQEGLGLLYKNGNNLLFEGAIIAGTGPDNIISSARGDEVGGTLIYKKDFASLEGLDLQITSPGEKADQQSLTIYEDSAADNPLHVEITQETFAFSAPPNDDYIFFNFAVQNKNSTPINNFHFGLFFDWDIDGEFFGTNKTGFDEERNLAFAFDTGDGPSTFVGTAPLTDGAVNMRAIFNDGALDSTGWGIYDGYSDEEKWQSISGGTTHTVAGPADISYSISSGPHSIDANQRINVAFVLAAGDDLADLQNNTDAAKARWAEMQSTAVGNREKTKYPIQFALDQNFPNPFNPSTKISYQVPKQEHVRLSIFNMNGQLVKVLVNAQQAAGSYSTTWNGTNEFGNQMPSGTYLYELNAGDFKQSHKMVYIK